MLLLAAAALSCGSSDEDDEPSAACAACSRSRFRCNGGFESFDIYFDVGGETTCTGEKRMPGLETPVVLQCDFSQICIGGACQPVTETSAGMNYGQTSCTRLE